MTAKPDIFLDSSALFSAIWSTAGGGRMILRLGEAGAIQLWVSSRVLTELENVLRRKAARALGKLTLVLNRSGVKIVPPPAPEVLELSQNLLSYQPDAQILAAAWSAGCDYFVTLDRKHFLNDQKIIQTAPFLMGTPGDFLDWYRSKLIGCVSGELTIEE
jgi:predicted nucleic acid-binding protein